MLFDVYATTLVVVAKPKSNEQLEQVKFITDFYRGYLNSKGAAHRAYEKRTPFFSKSALKLMANNVKICKEKSRGDDICGFGADGDIYLNTQESGPDLNFKTSDFKAEVIEPNKVEASFTVWPNEHEFYARIILFNLIKEKSSWRVDDIIYKTNSIQGAEQSAESAMHLESMRERIELENKNNNDMAKDLNDTWTWIRVYLGYKDMSERTTQFIHQSIKICDAKSKCKIMKKTDKSLQKILLQLNKYYSEDDKKEKKSTQDKWPSSSDFGKKESISVKVNQVEKSGPFTFTFIDQAWWLTELDLSKLAP